jgi:UDP-2-acetamido-3-amino-2,3-dideoxy-glucuronate N-acetyltransferase
MKYFKHKTAVIDKLVSIGDGTKIWHFSHISESAKIGKNVIIGQNVFIGKGVIIGDGCKIQNNVSVYEGVTLEDNVFVGPSVVFTNVNNPRSEIVRKNEYRKTLVMHGATLGANCTIVCGVTIGAFAFIGAGAVVSKSVAFFVLMVGVPAKQVGWMSAYGEKLDLPLTGKAEAICKHTKQKYRLKDNKVTLID